MQKIKNAPQFVTTQWCETFRFAAFFIFFFMSGLFFCPLVRANNLAISNASLTSQSTTNSTVKVQFDISWSNSWRNNTNYDAAWVFVKYSTDSGTTWNHATLKTSGTNPSGFTGGSGTSLDVIVPTDKKGAFLQRSSNGYGTLTNTSAQLVWDYGTDGLTSSTSAQIKVFGIEMVYVPTASFYLGDGNASSESTNALHVTDNTTFQVTTASTASVTVDSNANDDIDTTPIAIDGDGGITGNASYPTGYTAFYLMKYEITEGGWVDFFNTLTAAQKATRDITAASGKNSDSAVNRNTISWSSGDAATSRSDRAMNWISWMDGCAYADWAGLRPLTELEYEKAGRGANSAVYGEYAWGSTSLTAAATISGTEDGTETISTSGANANYNNTTFSGGDASGGPLRAGIFATSTSVRSQAGAGYYGNLGLSGNLNELVVTLGNSTGRSFTGTNGDGILTTTTSYEGNATNTDWPGIDGTASRGVTGATGSGNRGGTYSDTTAGRLSISDRNNSVTAASSRLSAYGFRAVRTAP